MKPRQENKHINHKKAYVAINSAMLEKKTKTKQKQTGSSLEVHTQNVSAHNNISELNNCTTCEG